PSVPLCATLALAAPLPEEAESMLLPLTRSMRAQGREVSGLQLLEAINTVQRLTRVTAQRWAEYDLIVCPSLAQPPALVGSSRHEEDPVADFDAHTASTPRPSVWD